MNPTGAFNDPPPMKTTDYARHAPTAMIQIAPAVSPWIMTAPVISTVHIRPEDDARLQNDDIGNGPVMADLKPGYLLCIDDLTDFEGCSDGMLHLLETFHDLGFHYLRLDPDGDRLDDLEREADHIACSCGNAAECASYDLETHTVTRHGQTVLKAVWFPEREAGQPTGPLKIEKVTHA